MGLRRRNPKAIPDDPPFVTTDELENAENDLTLELMRIVAHYKGVASSRVQEVLRLRKAQISDLIERLEKLKPLLPPYSPAAFARINAVRERCDALVEKAKLKHAELTQEAQRTSRYEYQRAAELRKQAREVLDAAQDEAAGLMLDAQAGEYISQVGDLFPDQTLRILAETSIEMYGGENAVRLREKEWRARWWDRKADEAAKAETASVLVASPVKVTESEGYSTMSTESAETAPGATANGGEQVRSPGTEETPEVIREVAAANPDLAQRRQKKGGGLDLGVQPIPWKEPGRSGAAGRVIAGRPGVCIDEPYDGFGEIGAAGQRVRNG